MDPQGWREVRALFDELIALLPIDRHERLERIGAVRPELCRSIEALLGADAAAPERLRRLDSLFDVSSDREDSFAPADEPATDDPLGLSGQRVSHFQVQGAVGAGGMGVVYRAEDTRLGRPVALKFLLPRLGLDASAKARFLLEARAAATLDHTNLCTIHEIGESPEGQLFLAMPLYPGETLRARLRREGPLPVAEVLAIALQIAHGLSAVHEAGIVHRDLKPGNVMLLPGGLVKLLDFGLATIRDFGVTGSDLRLGTLPYMAPEQVRDAGDVDARADLWALGVVLYEMLTGRLPFRCKPELSTVDGILREWPVAPGRLRQDLPAAADTIVMTLLQKEPVNRYANAEALLEDLAPLSAPEESSHQTWRRVRSTAASRTPAWPRRHAAALVLTVSAGVGGLGTLAVWRSGGLGTTRAAAPAVAAIAQQNAVAPHGELPPDERVRLTRGRASSPTAHDYVLRAREFLLRFNLRDNDAGLALLKQALELEPNRPEAHAAMGMALAMRYWQTGDRRLLDSAIVADRRAIVLDSTLAEAYTNLGWALDHSGDRDAALQSHRRAVELSPNHSGGLAVLHHWSFGRLDEAARWWAPALASDPTNTNTYWQAGKTYLCLGMLTRARELLGKSVAFEPSFAWAQYHLTLVFLREGNRGQARAQIARMLAANREDSSALTFAGLGAFAMKDLRIARGYLERGLEEAPAYERRQGTVGLAWILRQSGETERARELIEHASREFEQFWGGQPKRAEDFMDLARIRLLEGHREEALRLMETAVGRGWRFVYHEPNAPILESLQGNPRYDALIAVVTADIDRMRARVEREGW
jgi:tetratricopeptide (TPR) repeat protein